ncbi:hypothetical protein I4U23_017845 [Adineta vaga]|nr:hypothetical protein I4U23_017845 [Adineta vaga]
MLSLLPYIVLICITITIIVIIITMYRIRVNRTSQQILPYPTHVFFIAQPNQSQQNCSSVFWASTIDHLPPPYSAVVSSTNTNYSTVTEQNEL